jgi:hypothetical protein
MHDVAIDRGFQASDPLAFVAALADMTIADVVLALDDGAPTKRSPKSRSTSADLDDADLPTIIPINKGTQAG